MPTRPEIFVSATSQDLASCRQLVRDALLTMGCVPVVQDHFGPDARTVREMLRVRIAACDALIHLAGECYGAEPFEREPSQPRRSYTQMEYDMARELKKPVYTFICAPGFPYDAHVPEPPELRALQDAHRAALQARDDLYQPIASAQELDLHVRELQTRVDLLSRDLQRTRSWLGRGVAAALVALALVGAGLVALHQHGQRTEAKMAQVSDELDRYRQAVKALADNYGKDLAPGRKLTDQEKFDHALAAEAERQKISVEQLKTWMAVFVAQVRANPGADFYDKALADFAQQHFADAAANATKAAGQYHEQREAAEKEASTASERAGQARTKERLALTLVGDAEQAAGQYAAEIDPYQQALALTDKTQEPLLWCDVAQKLDVGLWRMARYGEAEPLAHEIMEKRTALQGPEHPDTLTSINNLANVHYMEGDDAGAEPLYRRCLEARERTLGKDHPDTLWSVNNLANVINDKGDYPGAEALYRRCLETHERTLGKDHPDTLVSVDNLAMALEEQDKYAEAEALDRRCLEARERTLGPEHPDTLKSVSSLANMLSAKGDYAEAEPFYRRCLEVRERTLGPEHPDTLGSLTNLALVLKVKGDYAGAEALDRRALAASERLSGKESSNTLKIVNNLAILLEAKGDYADAEALARRCLDGREHLFGKEHPDTLESINELASVLNDKGDHAGAETLFRRCLEAQERTLGKENLDTLNTVSSLAQALAAEGNEAAAEPLYARAQAGVEHALPTENSDRLDLDYHYSLFREKQGRLAEALSLAEQAAAGAVKTLPASSPDRIQYEKHLADLRAKLAAVSSHP